jgi:hypothetical protein
VKLRKKDEALSDKPENFAPLSPPAASPGFRQARLTAAKLFHIMNIAGMRESALENP